MKKRECVCVGGGGGEKTDKQRERGGRERDRDREKREKLVRRELEGKWIIILFPNLSHQQLGLANGSQA